jgi:acyl-CoA synthetase (NDP forming)
MNVSEAEPDVVTGQPVASPERARARAAVDLDRLLHPKAVTVVGASPNGQITEHLLRNLENRSCQFARPVHLINPKYTRIFDRPCLPSVADVPGDPGLVYLLVPADQCVKTHAHI